MIERSYRGVDLTGRTFENEHPKTHGYSRSRRYKTKPHPLYSTWAEMIQRCRYPKHIGYKYYGGMGVKVCRRWLRFENFLKDMGDQWEGHLTLERVNPNGNYCPSNCVWATLQQQANNKRSKK